MTDAPDWSVFSLVRNLITHHIELHPPLSHCTTDPNPGLGGDPPEEDPSSHQEHAQGTARTWSPHTHWLLGWLIDRITWTVLYLHFSGTDFC